MIDDTLRNMKNTNDLIDIRLKIFDCFSNILAILLWTILAYILLNVIIDSWYSLIICAICYVWLSNKEIRKLLKIIKKEKILRIQIMFDKL